MSVGIWDVAPEETLLLFSQRAAGPSLNQGVGGSTPALIHVSLSKTLHPELLPVAVSTVYGCKMVLWIKLNINFMYFYLKLSW